MEQTKPEDSSVMNVLENPQETLQQQVVAFTSLSESIWVLTKNIDTEKSSPKEAVAEHIDEADLDHSEK